MKFYAPIWVGRTVADSLCIICKETRLFTTMTDALLEVLDRPRPAPTGNHRERRKRQRQQARQVLVVLVADYNGELPLLSVVRVGPGSVQRARCPLIATRYFPTEEDLIIVKTERDMVTSSTTRGDFDWRSIEERIEERIAAQGVFGSQNSSQNIRFFMPQLSGRSMRTP